MCAFCHHTATDNAWRGRLLLGPNDKSDHAIVQGIIALARAFGTGIVAEGVASVAHLQTLLAHGRATGLNSS